MEERFKEAFSIEDIKTGDMPGDRIEISQEHMDKAGTIYPVLRELLSPLLDKGGKAVVSVHGGSGVGKSEIGALLGRHLENEGLGAYILSGDNYPHRIPRDNDAERLRLYREYGTKGLAANGGLTTERRVLLKALQEADRDAGSEVLREHPWMAAYIEAGRQALAEYLGTSKEIDFAEVNGIIRRFKAGEEKIRLKRMGRKPEELWYDEVDFSSVQVLIIEWTHGNNPELEGVDVPILLNSTPEETLAHRRKRNRDKGTDSPFVMMVLEIEQRKLFEQAGSARIILSKNGELLSYAQLLDAMKPTGAGAMLNAYPDSVGSRLSEMVKLLQHEALEGAFESFYILPSLFNTDLDRGFSVIDYDLDEMHGSSEDLEALKAMGMSFKFDFILNHASVLSPQFQDLLKHGEASGYKDFFINWNRFWEGCGEMSAEGHVQPGEAYLEHMFFRKPGLPILNVRMPDGTEVPYWNTFYQEVKYPEILGCELVSNLGLQYHTAQAVAALLKEGLAQGMKPEEVDFGAFEAYKEAVVDYAASRRYYLGQMDLNIKSPLVWEFYRETLGKLAGYGADIVRLDAFAYAPKEPGEKNFFNEPGTWDVLERVDGLAREYGLKLLPEIHTRYEEKMHEKIGEKGYLTYDFFLPGLLIDAFERKTNEALLKWIEDLVGKGIRTVNMLGCHDGIPLLDLKGLLTDSQIENLIRTVVDRGGYVKELHGKKNMYYQVNATYFSALGEDEKRLLLARAIQMFMPGKPQVWYLDLFAGRNDHEAMKRAGAGGHKEINRTNLALEDAVGRLEWDVVKGQLALLKFRNSCKAFGFDAKLEVVPSEASKLVLEWTKEGYRALLEADLESGSFTIGAWGPEGEETAAITGI